MKKFLSLIIGLMPFALMANNKKTPVAVASEPEPSYLAFQEKIEPIVEAKKQVVKKTFEERLTNRVQTLREGEQSRKLENGAKQFYYGDKFVIARDQKNADRKAKNLGYIS